MKSWLYAALDSEARRWWYHRQLRDQGQTAEARDRERQSIRRALKTWRSVLAVEGGHVSVGLGGHTVHYAEGATLSGYDNMQTPNGDPQIAVRLGVPVIDTTTTRRGEAMASAWKSPMVAVGRDPDAEPGALNFRPLAEVAAFKAQHGATLYNFDPYDEPRRPFRVYDLDTDESHGDYETLDDARGAVIFDGLIKWQIWYFDPTVSADHEVDSSRY